VKEMEAAEHQGVDEDRFAQLERKRDEAGLTDEEANELGRMMAAKEGRAYSNASGRQDPDALTGPESAPAERGAEPSPRRIPADPIDEATPEEKAKDIAG
jgi:hypothetical protein